MTGSETAPSVSHRPRTPPGQAARERITPLDHADDEQYNQHDGHDGQAPDDGGVSIHMHLLSGGAPVYQREGECVVLDILYLGRATTASILPGYAKGVPYVPFAPSIAFPPPR